MDQLIQCTTYMYFENTVYYFYERVFNPTNKNDLTLQLSNTECPLLIVYRPITFRAGTLILARNSSRTRYVYVSSTELQAPGTLCSGNVSLPSKTKSACWASGILWAIFGLFWSKTVKIKKKYLANCYINFLNLILGKMTSVWVFASPLAL